MSKKPFHIYALIDPDTQQIRYIGKTQNPKQRLAKHLNDKKDTAKCQWVQSLRAQGKKPEMILLDNCEWTTSLVLEAAWIQTLSEDGFPLTNKKYPVYALRRTAFHRG